MSVHSEPKPPRYLSATAAISVLSHAFVLAILVLWAGDLPDITEPDDDSPPIRLVFRVEAGPGGGGGGGGEGSAEPPSVQKIEGPDAPGQAIATTPPERLVFRKEPPVEKEEEPTEEQEDVTAVRAPFVDRAPDDVTRKGILEGEGESETETETETESAGPGTGGGGGTGEGGGIGPGKGPGVGEGEGGGFGGGAYRVGSGDIDPPVPLYRVEPEYTDDALQRKLAGTVRLEIIILADGSVGSVRILEGLDPGLDESAIRAARQWRFRPGTRKGQPVAVIAEIVMEFRLL